MFSDDSDSTITSPRQKNKKGETHSNDDEVEKPEQTVPAMYKTIRDEVRDSKQETRRGLDSSSMTSVGSRGSLKKSDSKREVNSSEAGGAAAGTTNKMVVPTVNVIASSEVDESSVSRKNSNSIASEFEAPNRAEKKKETHSSDSEENMKDWYNDNEALANAGLI